MARFEDLSVNKLRLGDPATVITATAAEINAAADISNISSKVEQVTAGRVLTLADHGMTFVLGDAAPGNITLPAMVGSTGFKVKVICGFAITSDAAVISPEGDNIEGSMLVAGAIVDIDAADQLNFINTADNIGDFVELESNGTYWFAFGNALTAGGLTATG